MLRELQQLDHIAIIARIAEGPFADQVASITQLAPQDRIKVLLNVLGGYVTATVPRRSIYPI